jgi:hypothetical protein
MPVSNKKILDASFLPWTTAVVRNGGTIFNDLDGQTSSLQGSDRTFPATTWAFDANFTFSHPELNSLFTRLLCRTLSGKRGAFAASLETGSTRSTPAQSITFQIGDRHNGVVEGRIDVDNANGNVAADFSFFRFCHGGGSSGGLLNYAVIVLVYAAKHPTTQLQAKQVLARHAGITRSRQRLLAKILDAFLSSHRLARTLASSCVGLGALPANRQPDAVTNPAITFDFPQPSNVLPDLTA